MSAMLVPIWDPYHRQWNDLKLAYRSCGLFKVMLQYSLVFNLNYGPSGSRAWFLRKQQAANDFLQQHDAHSEPFLSYLPFLARDLKVEEPSTPAGRDELFQMLSRLRSLQIHEPLVKLMRWYSFVESNDFYQGETFFTKMIVSKGCDPQLGLTPEDQPLSPELESGQLGHKEELRQLKVRLGCWALVPKLIAPASFWKKELLVFLGKPCWDVYSHRAKHCKTPQQVEADTVAKASSDGWAAEVHALLDNGFYGTSQLYPSLLEDEDIALEQHFSCLCALLEKRVQSLSSFYLRPPIRYAGILMQQEWDCLLAAESEHAQCKSIIQPLTVMHWRLNQVNRLAFVTCERDRVLQGNDTASIIKLCVCNIGDTAIIENIHQQAKDTQLHPSFFQLCLVLR